MPSPLRRHLPLTCCEGAVCAHIHLMLPCSLLLISGGSSGEDDVARAVEALLVLQGNRGGVDAQQGQPSAQKSSMLQAVCAGDACCVHLGQGMRLWCAGACCCTRLTPSHAPACIDGFPHANLAHAAAPNAPCLQPWADAKAARVETYQLLLTLLFSGRPNARCVPRPSGMLYPRGKVLPSGSLRLLREHA